MVGPAIVEQQPTTANILTTISLNFLQNTSGLLTADSKGMASFSNDST
jgi:hypothetical protein